MIETKEKKIFVKESWESKYKGEKWKKKEMENLKREMKTSKANN